MDTVRTQTQRAWSVWVIMAALSAGVWCADAPSAQAQDLRYSATVEGGLAITGNTLGLSNAEGVNGPGTRDSIGTFISTDQGAIDLDPVANSPWFGGTTSNWRLNSSAATLDLPASGTVLYAELVWAGSHSYGADVVTDLLDTPVTLRAPGGASTAVAPDPTTPITLSETAAAGFAVNYYLRSADVTDFVRQHGAGSYTVAGVPGTQDAAIRSTNGLGWTLVVAYADSSSPTRNLSIFTGGRFVDEDSTQEYTVSGFCSPETGPVQGRVVVSAVEGDAVFTGDQILIADPDDVAIDGDAAFAPLWGPNNPIDNFFGSQVNGIDGLIDVRGTFGALNHDAELGTNVIGGRQGWDLTGVEVTSAQGQLNQGQRSAVIRTTGDGDSYLPTLVAFAINVNAPDFNTAGSSSITPATAVEGESVTLQVRLDNRGQADAEDVVFFQPLPDGLTLTRFAIDNVDGDRFGNPVATGDLSVGVQIGTVPNNTTRVITMVARVDSVPVSPSLAQFRSQPFWTYRYRSCASSEPLQSRVESPELTASLPRMRVQVQAQSLGGGVVRYTITASNTGAAPTRAATLEATIPAGATYVAGSTAVDGLPLGDIGGQMPFATPRAIASSNQAPGVVLPDTQVVVTYDVRLDGAGGTSVTSSATVDADGPGPSPGVTASVLTEVGTCGDGRWTSDEQCDDNNLIDGDGCSSTCAIEDGFACHGEQNQTSDCDPDTDSDGLSDPFEDQLGTDPLDPDSDDDGLTDGVEVLGDNPTNPSLADTDQDGLCDGPGAGDGVCRGGEDGEDANANGQLDAGETDPNDADTDNGGINDGEEVGRGTDPLDPSDDLDVDTDGDGLTDGLEAQLGTSPTNPDSDGDGLCDGPNAVSGVCDPGEDANANGQIDPGETNPNDADTDGDGLTDGVERLGGNPTDPLNPDSDGDGLCDGPGASVPDICAGGDAGEDADADGELDEGETDPNTADTDGDGLTDGVERLGGNPTDPLNPDSDGDGLCDGIAAVTLDICTGGEDVDADGELDDGETNPNDDDTDDGGVNDGDEVGRGSDPFDPSDDFPEDDPGSDGNGDGGGDTNGGDSNADGVDDEFGSTVQGNSVFGPTCATPGQRPVAPPALVWVVFGACALVAARRRRRR